MTTKKILILTCSHGSGHQMVTQALKEYFLARGCEVFARDLFHDTNAVVNRIIEKSYLLSYNIGSLFYKKMYYDMEKRAHGPFISKLWTLTRHTLLKMIDTLQPDCIINAYPYTISSMLKPEHYPDIPVFTVVTDFCIPAAWEHKNTDKFYVACDKVEESLLRFGIDPRRILKTGIPIRPEFYHAYDRQRLLEKYHLSPDKKTLILCAGTYGVLKNTARICKRLDAFDDLQTVVICGKNRSLYHSLSSLDLKHTQVLGFVKNIYELYHCGDMMITKPGGITLSEVVATRIPLILYRPVPGQEGENADWFKKQGAAVIARTEPELLVAIEALKNNEVQQFAMKNALAKMDYGCSAQLIADDILSQLNLFPAQRTDKLPALKLLEER
ncbi:MAG: glycosyltransferase [Eubacterium sp.]|nr:glycosyltransferase [Eubacterium sp.]